MDTERIVVSAETWRWALNAAEMLTALRLCGVEKLPVWTEAERMCSGQPQAQTAGLAVVRRGGAYGQ